MKNVSIRIPEAAPFGETFLEASVLAIVAAFFVNNPAGTSSGLGCDSSYRFLSSAIRLLASSTWHTDSKKFLKRSFQRIKVGRKIRRMMPPLSQH